MNSQILSQDEVDALLQGITGDGDAAEGRAPAEGGVRRVDFAGAERPLHARLPALETVHERFARHIRARLAALLRRSVEVAIGGVKVHKYGAFLREIVVPTNFNVVAVKPLRGSGLVVCDPNVVFAAVDALFGGAGKFHTRIEGREFSATETRVIARLLQAVCEAYAQAWQGLYPLQLQPQRAEMQPQFATIAADGDMVVSCSFTLEVGETSGAIHVVIPYAVLEPIRHLLVRPVRTDDGGGDDPRWLEQMKTQLEAAEVELVAELATAQATLEQLLSFKPGDFLELDLEPAIEAKVDGVPLFHCHYGTANNRYAIKIDRLISNAGHTGWLGEQDHVR